MEGSPPFVLQVEYAISGGLAVWQGDIVLGSVDDLRRSTPENPHSYRVRSDRTRELNIDGLIILSITLSIRNCQSRPASRTP
jgi:hypothetical protein